MPRTHVDLMTVIRATGVREQRVLDALAAVRRGEFVPPERIDSAYLDRPIPIPCDQVTTQPSLVARMVAALELSPDDSVLEIGTGYGFQTAVLARLARFVWSIERFADLAESARGNLARHGTRNVEVVVGDGYDGLPEHAPFDAVIVSAAFPRVPDPLTEQLALDGRLVQPIGTGGNENVELFARTDSGLERRKLLARARFVPLQRSR